MRHVEDERRVIDFLATLRVESPVVVDVTTRVMRGLARSGPPRREEVTPQQLLWAASAALLAGIGLIVGFSSLLPELTRLVSAAPRQLQTASGLIAAAATPIAALLSAATKIGAGLVVAMKAIGDWLTGFKQLAVFTAVLCSTLMATVIVLVVGRDLKRVLGAALCLTTIGLALPVEAQTPPAATPSPMIDKQGDVISIFSGDVQIPADLRQDGSVICIGGDVTIEGEVTQDVVVILGSLELDGSVGGDTAAVLADVTLRHAEVSGNLVNVLGDLKLVDSTVDGEMTHVLGALDRDRLSRIAGEFVNIGIGSWAPSFWVLLLWLRLFHKFAVFVLLLLLAVLIPERIRAIGDEAPVRYVPAFFVGFLGYLGLLALGTLLSVTLVGIPMLWAAFWIFKWIGIAGIFYAIGRRMGRTVGREMSLLGALLLVFALYVLSSLIPGLFGFFGLLIVLTLRLLFFFLIELPAIGLVLLTLAGGRPRPTRSAEPPPPTGDIGPNPG